MNDYIIIPLSKRGKHAGKFFAVVDREDEVLAKFNWQIINGKYARRTVNKQCVWLHCAVIERMLGHPLEEGKFPDHINGDGTDCTRGNLRVATISQNNANRRGNQNTVSGYKGVGKHRNKWKARIRINKKYVHIGVYDTAEEAHEAYKEAAKKHFGEFARFE